MATLTPALTATGRSVAIGIRGTGAYVPERIVSNAEVGAPAGVDDAWIRRKTGIRERRWAAPHQATSDLAVAAARSALDQAGIEPAQLSQIVVATSTPDYPQPPTAAIVQSQLGATGAAAYDLNAVCAGFEFALNNVSQLLSCTGGYALVIGADLYSRILNPADRRTVILFGDGAGAVVLGPSLTDPSDAIAYAGPAVPGHEVIATKLMSFGDFSMVVSVPVGGSREPFSAAHQDSDQRFFQMNGRAVREFVVNEIPPMIHEFLAESGLNGADIRHLVPHQANAVMLEELRLAIDLPFLTTHTSSVETLGNTGSASIPIALAEVDRQGLIKPGELVLLAGIGGGLSVGLTVLRW